MRAKKISAVTGIVAIIGLLVWAFSAVRGITRAAADAVNEGESRPDPAA